MTVKEAILTLNANAVIACERAGFSSATVKMIEDALDTIEDALKAQEPRVMTLEEYKVWADIPFCERDPIFHEMKLRRGPVTGWTNTAECSIENYGKTERCWTSRPTEAEREAVKWE